MNLVAAAAMLATLTAVSGFTPYNYNDVSFKPTEVRLLPLTSAFYDNAFVSAQLSTRTADPSYRATFTLLYDYYFVPTKAYCTYEDGKIFVQAMDYLLVDVDSINTAQRAGVMCFRSVSTGSTARYYEYSYSPETYSEANLYATLFTNTIISHSSSGYADTYGTPYLVSSIELSNNSELVYNTFALCSSIAPYVWQQVCLLNQNEGYKWAYDEGYSDGYGNEDRGGYHDGYHDGLIDGAETTAGNVFTDLVESIIGVPMSILGGLSIFSIFDTPIISIIVTFLLIAIALLVVKRFI